MPRGTIQERLTAMRITEITVVRSGTAQTPLDVYLDWSAKGREQLLGAGAMSAFTSAAAHGGIVDGVAIYAEAGADLRLGDVFAHGGAQYRVAFTAPLAVSHVSGDVMTCAWASAQRAT